MSDTASHAATPSEHDAKLFSDVEIEQFGTDDVIAGGAIGKMLSALFLYTVFAMGIAGWWTYSSIIKDKASAESRQNAKEHAGDQEFKPGSKSH